MCDVFNLNYSYFQTSHGRKRTVLSITKKLILGKLKSTFETTIFKLMCLIKIEPLTLIVVKGISVKIDNLLVVRVLKISNLT